MKDFMEWWNAIYWVPLCLSLLWILLTALSGHGHAGGAGHAHAAGGHLGAHAGHGHFHLGHFGHGHGAGHATGASHAAPAHHGHHTAQQAPPQAQAIQGAFRASLSSRVMDLLGLGRIPITLVIGVYMLLWGSCGLLANSFLRDAGLPPGAYILPSLVGTFLVTSIITRLSVGVIARVMPTTESFAITETDLIGREGSVVYEITANAGTVQVNDVYGTLHRRMAKTEPEAGSLPPNSKVIVVGIDETDNRLVVREYSETTQIP